MHRQTGRIYISRDVVFDENVFPFHQASKNSSFSTPPISKYSLFPSLPTSIIPSQSYSNKNPVTTETLHYTDESVSVAYLPDIGTLCAEPLGEATLSLPLTEAPKLHDGADAAIEPLSPHLELVILAIPSPRQTPPVMQHRMLIHFQDNILRSKE